MSGDRPEVPLLFGPYGGLPEELAPRARESGVNAVWFHMFAQREFDLCGRLGLAPCVELKTFRVDFAKRPELRPVGADGEPMRHGALVQGVCLSHPEFVQEIEATLTEGLRRFRPAGVWLDYLSYPGWFETPEPDLQESCFCTACIRDFCEAAGVDADSPAAILEGHRRAWSGHKTRRIAAFGARFAAVVRSLAPGCVVGAYMCPWRPEELDGALGRIFGQDYRLLAPWIDVFTPLIYAAKSGRPPDWAGEFLRASPSFVPPGSSLQLILDDLDFPASLSSTAASAVPSRGLQIFGGARLFGDPRAARCFRESVQAIRDAWA